MDEELVQSLIRFHKAGLLEHRQSMAISAVYLEEQTIKALEELKRVSGSEKYKPSFQEAGEKGVLNENSEAVVKRKLKKLVRKNE